MSRAFTLWILVGVSIGGASAQSMERTLQNGLPARWWKQPALVQKLGLSAEQQKKLDDAFLQSRLKLIDLNAALEKEEALLEPMVGMDRPDETKIRAQIDRIALARADLEKENAYLLLRIRMSLSPEQWRNLQAGVPRPPAGPGASPVPRKGR